MINGEARELLLLLRKKSTSQQVCSLSLSFLPVFSGIAGITQDWGRSPMFLNFTVGTMTSWFEGKVTGNDCFMA